ncbi:glycosyltransferase family 9 protein [Bdellovibrio sp. ZAP7]|uniref:glycosyltransferase family 9 protein n=1 Tax=Bdellovibrio sp. ZAP7 TaxID=2231053 RepID=UPI0011572154|nr:glycosyltransferase family 9 protein [Bdellovibrio sp. ZAP7]QDK46694.1 glycosyltransferase family 9 protein [Bdellovibrio sp. ZAP7]
MQKVLLIRLDKIGDLISTMCVDQAQFMSDKEVKWVIAKGLGFVPDNADPKRSYIELSKDDWKTSLKSLRAFIREYKPDVAVSFQAPWWVAFALWAEGVKVRAGVQSQWHSFLFLNKGLRQRRSKAVQHEADYNMDLLRFALDEKSKEPAPVLKLVAAKNPELLAKHSLTEKNYVVVHPGMAGSALNWPTARYISLIEQITPFAKVALTGTPADEPFLTEIKARFKNDSQVINLQNQLKPAGLFAILKNAKAVVVPSTGVAHMAASLGAPVLGLYSPIRVQHPRRWAARGENVKIFVSKNENPPYDHAMEEIQVEDLLKALNTL